MLAKLGIDASLVIQEYPVWISSTYKGSFEGLAHIPAWTLGDEDEWLGAYTPGDTRNQLHLDDPKLTELVQMARGAPNEAVRAKLIGQFVTTFHEQMYRVFLPAPRMMTVTSKRVQGYVPPVRGYGYAIALVNTWLE
jgi:ABC-type transport system substrate-binding protein